VRFRFNTRKLERLYTEEQGRRRYPDDVVDAFFDVVGAIDSAADERDLYALKHLHYEKLKGQRAHQRSLRLAQQFRLVLQRLEDDDGVYLLIETIEDYH
jgi:proteic killer suppression protein